MDFSLFLDHGMSMPTREQLKQNNKIQYNIGMISLSVDLFLSADSLDGFT